jgi:hypothetical protein
MINYDKLNLFYLFWGLRFWGKHVYFVDQSSEMFGRFLIFLYNWNCLGTVPFFRMTFQGQSFAEAWIFAFFGPRNCQVQPAVPIRGAHPIIEYMQ